MSYPVQRYSGAGGERTARLRRGDSGPDFGSASGAGTAYHYLAATASTGGEFGLYRLDMGPEPGGPAVHFHRTISESFFVLSGTVRVFDGERWVDAVASDFLYVPVGGLHAFRNESGEPASMLLLFAPGAPREAYFEGLPALAKLGDAERSAFQIAHDSYFV